MLGDAYPEFVESSEFSGVANLSSIGIVGFLSLLCGQQELYSW